MCQSFNGHLQENITVEQLFTSLTFATPSVPVTPPRGCEVQVKLTLSCLGLVSLSPPLSQVTGEVDYVALSPWCWALLRHVTAQRGAHKVNPRNNRSQLQVICHRRDNNPIMSAYQTWPPLAVKAGSIVHAAHCLLNTPARFGEKV